MRPKKNFPPAPGATTPPPRPRDESFEQLGFRIQRRMVDWLSPVQLLKTGVRAAMAEEFGSYADKREIQSGIAEPALIQADYSDQPELWFDYVADVGDGFNPTYAIASLIAQEQLAIGGAVTTRGRFLLMGGDQVYPAPSKENYRDRLVGPYRAALPWADDPPAVFAIPGNHDWYDGLTSFLRLFCQQPRNRWIGGWEARQTRSYFALRLPHDWWIWGADMQLEADIDTPQILYFHAVAAEMHRVADACGSRPKLILVTPEPNWIFCSAADPSPAGRGLNTPEKFDGLRYFETELIHKNGLALDLVISGDLHHYCRYQRSDEQTPAWRITSGGGGAYLAATHHMPQSLTVPEGSAAQAVRYRLACAYPERDVSRALAFGSLLLPFRNWRFSLLMGCLYLLAAWINQSASVASGPASLADRLEPWPGFSGAFLAFSQTLLYSPSSIVFGLLVIAGLTAYAWREGKAYRPWLPVVGVFHGAAHVAVGLLLFALFVNVNAGLPWVPASEVWRVPVFLVEMLVAGSVIGGVVFALYLLAVSWSGAHINDVFSSQAIQHYKHFLRFHIDAAGSLTMYAIGLNRVPSWALDKDPSRTERQPWFHPASGTLDAHLIDKVVQHGPAAD